MLFVMSVVKEAAHDPIKWFGVCWCRVTDVISGQLSS